MTGEQKPLKVTKIYANPIEPNPPTAHQIVAPTAMAELEIMKDKSAKSVTGRNLEVRNVALLLLAVLGINLFSQFGLLLINNSMGNSHNGLNEFIKSNGLIGIVFILIQLVAIFVLLFTRNVSIAKIIIVVAAISVAVNIAQGLTVFSIGPGVFLAIVSLAVNLFIFWRIFKAYQSF